MHSASSIPAVIIELGHTQPDRLAYTFVDYEAEPSGSLVESLTWSQVLRRAQAVAEELARHGSPGDRAAIVAPQSLDYIVGFFGAMLAGFIAVPLSAPQSEHHDERIASALGDCDPEVILTTSAAIADVMPYAADRRSGPAPTVVEIDALQVDPSRQPDLDGIRYPETAYLQYTSGSTRQPAGVMVSHRNVFANLEQVFADYFPAGIPWHDTTFVSWLPFYHDMGLVEGVFAPLLAPPPTPDGAAGRSGVLMSPMAFLLKPARWMQLLARHGSAWSAAPNFAFDLAARRTSDEDLAGLDLGGVRGIINGSERIHSATIRRFNERFARFNLPDTTVVPSYGLAEATLYVASAPHGHQPTAVRFDPEKLSAGYAKRYGAEGGTELVSYGPPRSSMIRIVDPETSAPKPDEEIGEIWVHGDNVAQGYWRNPGLSERTFGAMIAGPTANTPAAPWLRTGDLGVLSDGELFIIGRIKDLLIVNGRNHYPDDIEATVQEITGGRVAAIAVPDEDTERLVAVVEYKQRGTSDEEMHDRLRTVKREVTSAISKNHSVRLTDLVLVAPGTIPITTSGKVRRWACVERYRSGEFSRLDVGV